MARRRKKKKLPGIKKKSLFSLDLSEWSDEKLWFFFFINRTLYRTFARQQWKGRMSEEEAASIVRYVFNNSTKEDLCNDIRIVHKGMLTIPHDTNWHKKFYRELVVLVNLYLRELKTGEETYSPPVNLPTILDDRWVFHGYQFSELEEELILNFNNRYLLYSLYRGETLKELSIDPSIVDSKDPVKLLVNR